MDYLVEAVGPCLPPPPVPTYLVWLRRLPVRGSVERRTYDFVVDWWANHGYGPSHSVLSAHLGVHRSGVKRVLRPLLYRGLLTKDLGVDRTLRPVCVGQK